MKDKNSLMREASHKSTTECDIIVIDSDSSCSDNNTVEDCPEIICEKKASGFLHTSVITCHNNRASKADLEPSPVLGDSVSEVVCLSLPDDTCNSSSKPSCKTSTSDLIILTCAGKLGSAIKIDQDNISKNSEIFCIDSLPESSGKVEEMHHCTNETNISNKEKSWERKNLEDKMVLSDSSDLFCFDTKPESSKKKTLGPRFKREFSSILKNSDKVENNKDAVKTDNRCFNCRGDHSLSTCPQPKDQQEIQRNRAAFLKSQPIRLKNRYHEEKDSPFDRFKPGVLSDSLRRALGLRDHEIPWHIYKMRLLGYPPGWIEDLKQHDSGLEFFDSPGNSNREETKEITSFDFSRIIEYPGFNVPLRSRYRDDWQYLNMPPMQPYHLKENFIEMLKRHADNVNNVPKPKKIRFNSGNQDEPPNLEVIDMEVTIEDLEEQRQALLARLQDECSSSDSTKTEVGDSNEIITIVDDEKSTTEQSAIQKANTTLAECPSPNSSTLLKVGTPVAIRHSPYSTLPSRDKFAKHMGDLELYENLPNTTGTFQKMKTLLEKVRRVFKKK